VGRIFDPSRGSDDFKRERGGHQKLGQELVGVQRDRGQQRVELFGVERLGRRRLGDTNWARRSQRV
jgi:hypothetical protein